MIGVENVKKILCIVLSMILILGLCACSNDNKDLIEYETELFFGGAGKTGLASEKAKVYVETMDKIYDAVVNKLLEGPSSQNVVKLIPEETKLISSKLTEGILTLNFSKEIYTPEESENILIRTSLVRTMTAMSEITGVMILVDGKPMVDSDGEEIGILNREDVVYDTEPETEEKIYIKLYFSDLKSEKLIAEAREITVSQKESMEMRVLKELIKGPVNPKLMKTIPAETKILSVETKEGVCFVNLSQDFKNKHTGGSAGEMMTVYSIVNSLTEIDGVEKVQFLIEGQKKDVFIHLIFNEPFERDAEIIQK